MGSEMCIRDRLNVLAQMSAGESAVPRPVRVNDVVRELQQQSSMPLDMADINEALQALSVEGTVQLTGDRERRSVRLV